LFTPPWTKCCILESTAGLIQIGNKSMFTSLKVGTQGAGWLLLHSLHTMWIAPTAWFSRSADYLPKHVYIHLNLYIKFYRAATLPGGFSVHPLTNISEKPAIAGCSEPIYRTYNYVHTATTLQVHSLQFTKSANLKLYKLIVTSCACNSNWSDSCRG
jgi:hypothetical protein